LRLPEIQLLAVAPTQLKFSILKFHDEPTILLFETLFCMWECSNMGTDLPTKVMLGQALVLMQITFLNNVRKVVRLVLSRTSCYYVCCAKIIVTVVMVTLLRDFCPHGFSLLTVKPMLPVSDRQLS
jgi:hypothetical protein